jgi:hypothetical protein
MASFINPNCFGVHLVISVPLGKRGQAHKKSARKKRIPPNKITQIGRKFKAAGVPILNYLVF